MALIFEIKVVPSSGQNKWILDKAGMLKCYLKSPPEKGKANKELTKLLSEVVQCPQYDIEIIAGMASRKKKIKVNSSMTHDDLLQRLNLKTGQQSFF